MSISGNSINPHLKFLPCGFLLLPGDVPNRHFTKKSRKIVENDVKVLAAHKDSHCDTNVGMI